MQDGEVYMMFYNGTDVISGDKGKTWNKDRAKVKITRIFWMKDFL